MANLEQIIKARRSIRRFKPDLVPIEVIKETLDSARYAPSACNIQGWRFIVVTDERIKSEIFDNGGNILIKNSPQSILFLYDNRTDNEEYKDYIQSASAVIQNFLLLTKDKGIGTCWINHLPKKKVLQRIFKLPRHLEPIALVIFGYPLNLNNYEVPRREKIEEMLAVNNSDFKPFERQVGSIKYLKIFKKIYYLLPKSIKKLLNKYLDKKFVKKFDN